MAFGLELEALKQRFWKHANPAAKPRAAQQVNVNIIVKDVGPDGKEELKADTVAVTLAAEKLDGASHTKPGICGHGGFFVYFFGWGRGWVPGSLYSGRTLWLLKTL